MRTCALFAALAAMLALGLAACGTPEPVRELASRTAANTAQVGNQLNNLNAASQTVAEARATNVARLKSTVREVRERHSLDLALTKKSGDSSSISVKNELETWILEARAAAHAMTVDEFKAWQRTAPVDSFSADVKAIMDSLATLDTKSEQLKEVGKMLADLSEEDDLKARVQFLVAYVKEVHKEVEEKQAAAEEAAKKAKSAAMNAGDAAGSSAGK